MFFSINIPHDIYFAAFAVLIAVMLFICIPNMERRRLFAFGIIWGTLGSFTFVKVFSGILNFFQWMDTPFTFLGSPLLLNLSWAAALMIYLYFLPKEKHIFWLYLVAVSFVSAGIDSVFHELGTLSYNYWNPLARFFAAMVWFLGATLHYNYLSKGKITPYAE